MTLLTPEPSVELDVPPMQTPQPSHTETKPVGVPYPDSDTMQDDELSLIVSPHDHLNYYAKTRDEVLGEGEA